MAQTTDLDRPLSVRYRTAVSTVARRIGGALFKSDSECLADLKASTPKENRGLTVAFSVALLLIFGWFLYQAIYFANSVRSHIAPDEHQHFLVSRIFFENGWFFPRDNDQTYFYGPLSAYPYLYNVILGKLFHLNFFGLDQFVFARYLNVAFSALGFWASFLVVRELSHSRLVQLAALFFQTNLLMFAFNSGMVSYDNVVNPLAWASFYFVIRYLKTGARWTLLWAVTWSLAGALTKFTFLPLCLVFTVLVGAFLFRHRDARQRLVAKPAFYEWILFAFILVGLGLNLNLYGKNLLMTGQIMPRCDRVLAVEICKTHAGEFKRDDAFLNENKDAQRFAFLDFSQRYFKAAQASIIGIMAHRGFRDHSRGELRPYRYLYNLFVVTFLLSLGVLIRSKFFWIYLGTSVFYVLVVMLDNYSSYLKFGVFGAGLQGRYWFPVLAPLCSTVAFVVFFRLKWYLGLLVLGYFGWQFVQGGYFYFLRHVDPSWLNPVTG